MNKKDKNTLNEFHISYENSGNPELPDELSKENIIMMLDKKEAPKSKNRMKIFTMKSVLAATLAVIIIAGSIFVYDGISGGIKISDGDSLSSDIEAAGNYDEIVKIFKKIKKENHVIYEKGAADNDLTIAGDSAFNGASDESAQESAIGKTNTQVEGVDEADIIKNDGQYLYKLLGNKVYIIDLLPADKMSLVTCVDVSKDIKTENDKEVTTGAGQKTPENAPIGNDGIAYDMPYSYSYYTSAYVNEIYVTGSKLIVLGSNYDLKSDSGVMQTFVNIYDVSDKTKITLKKQFFQDGNYISSRLIGSDLYILSNFSVDIYADDVEDRCIPSSGYSDDYKLVPVNDICIVSEPDTASYLVASGLDIDNPDNKACTKSVLGAGNEAYCNTESLFVARTKYNYSYISDTVAEIFSVSNSSCSTEIYRFSIDGGKIEFVCKGEINGNIDNQFSMDEYNGYFRIASTYSDDDGEQASGVYVLDGSLKVVGKVTGIAKGEQIQAVRFIGAKAYVVTFEQTDPLFVLDLSSPENPKLLGELKITGFSDYLHPVGENLLLGIGQNGDENGTTTGIKLSLFDVTNPAKPVEIDKYILKRNAGNYSIGTSAWDNHKAVMIYKEKNLFGIPVTVYDYSYSNYSNKKDDYFFYTFRVENNKIVPDLSYNCSEYDFRGTYIDDNVYVVSDYNVNAYSMTDGKLLGSVELQSAH